MKKKRTNLPKVRALLDNVLRSFERELGTIEENPCVDQERSKLIRKNEELLSVLTKIFNLEIKIHKAECDFESWIESNKNQEIDAEITEEDIKILSGYLQDYNQKSSGKHNP